MHTFVLVVHVILSVLLILIVLAQPGKGADISSAFGGGAATQLFGASGPGNFLTRGTGFFAAMFMVTSIGLSLYSTESSSDLDVAEEGVEEGAGWTPKAPTDAPPADVPPAGVAPTETPAPSEAPVPAADPAAAPGVVPTEAPPASTTPTP